MIYKERKRERKKWKEGGGAVARGFKTWCKPFGRERRLPAQPALFKLGRKWPYIQHASNLPLSETHTHTLSVLRSVAGHWLHGVCLLLLYYVSLHHRRGHSRRYYHFSYYYNPWGWRANMRARIKEREETREKRRRGDWIIKVGAGGRTRGQCFPSTQTHDLILWSFETETFPGTWPPYGERDTGTGWRERGRKTNQCAKVYFRKIESLVACVNA